MVYPLLPAMAYNRNQTELKMSHLERLSQGKCCSTESDGASSMVALMKVFHLLCLQSNDDHLKVEAKLQRWSQRL